MDDRGRVISANPAAEKIFYAKAEHLIGRCLLDFRKEPHSRYMACNALTHN